MELLLDNPAIGERPRERAGRTTRIGFGIGTKARSLERLVLALESRAPGTVGHSRRVGIYAAGLARDAGLSRAEARRVKRAGALHDVGKSKIPAEILNKAWPLTEPEQALVRSHAEIGAAMVADLADPELTETIRHHHERYDGGGYPDGLAAEGIPLGARLVAVCDTFDALTSRRPYRRAIGFPEALELLDREAGSQLDPDLVGLFRERFERLWAAA
jgi:putative nucleotidyltransferase with HDIG domain